MKGKRHFIEVDLREGWVLAGLLKLEAYLRKHAAFLDYQSEERPERRSP